MNSFNLDGFFTNYTLPTIIVAVVVAIIYIVLTIIFADKLFRPVKTFFPFICSLLLYYLYELIFVKAHFPPSQSTLSCGIVAGSLSTMIVAVIKRIKKGKTSPVDAVILVIEGIVCDYVNDSALSITSLAIKELLEEKLFCNEIEKDEHSIAKDNHSLLGDVAQIIKDNSDKQFTDVELRAVASLTVSAVKQIKKS